MPVRYTIQYPDSGLLAGEREILESFEDDLKSYLLWWTGTIYENYSWHVRKRGNERVGLLVCNWTEEKVFERRISAIDVKSPEKREELIRGITFERDCARSSSQSGKTPSDDETPA